MDASRSRQTLKHVSLVAKIGAGTAKTESPEDALESESGAPAGTAGARCPKTVGVAAAVRSSRRRAGDASFTSVRC